MLLEHTLNCSDVIKTQLFNAYVRPFYCASVWSNFKQESLRKLRVGYNDIFRLLFKYPRFVHVSPLFVKQGIDHFTTVLNKQRSGIFLRIIKSRNSLISSIPMLSIVRLV